MSRIVLALAFVVACKKSSPQGLPPASDWNAKQAPPVPADHTPQTAEPPGPAPAPAAEKTLDKLPDGRLGLGPYSLAVPAGWSEVPTKSEMRAAQFAVGDAELVIYYFGADGAGSVSDNIDRWVNQFEQPDGKPSKDVAKIEQKKILGFDATLVSVSGNFHAMAMPGGPPPTDKADQSMLGAITGSPKGPYYWKLVGPKATIAANAAKFSELLGSLKLR